MFVDIGDKGWGVLACQKYLGGIDGSKTLHVGDQFLSAGANDFKVCLTPLLNPLLYDLQFVGEIGLHDCLDSKPCGNGRLT